jgi:hypothetical protein
MALAGGSGTEYRLQTRESSAWYDEFRAQEAELKAAPQRVEQKRADLLKGRFGEVLKKVRVVQGKDNVERTPHAHLRRQPAQGPRQEPVPVDSGRLADRREVRHRRGQSQEL